MRIAYADPPYIGQARKHYQCEEVDHHQLIDRLAGDYDAWLLSASAPSLPSLTTYLDSLKVSYRVAVWVKPFAAFKVNVNPAYAWEPVLFGGGRPFVRYQPTVRDWLAESMTLRKGLCGAKPPRFCRWIFSLVNAEPSDELTDLFPGTGIVGREWASWDGSPEIGGAPVALKHRSISLREATHNSRVARWLDLPAAEIRPPGVSLDERDARAVVPDKEAL